MPIKKIINILCVYLIKQLTLVTLSATPSGKFLCVYSKNVSAVEPVSL